MGLSPIDVQAVIDQPLPDVAHGHIELAGLTWIGRRSIGPLWICVRWIEPLWIEVICVYLLCFADEHARPSSELTNPKEGQ